jgi:hypothetical protein
MQLASNEAIDSHWEKIGQQLVAGLENADKPDTNQVDLDFVEILLRTLSK